MDVLDALPDGPCLVVSSSSGGQRASAIKCLRQALQEGWTRDKTLAYAEREALPFLKKSNEHLTDWVLGTVARCVRCRTVRLDRGWWLVWFVFGERKRVPRADR